MNKSDSKYFNTSVKFDKALLSLLENKPFEYITISEICGKAGVNRSTFYLHYENTSDLLEETTSYVIDNFSSYFSEDAETVAQLLAGCNLQDLEFINEKYLFPYLSFIKENQRLFSTILTQPRAFGSNAIFNKLFDNILAPVLDRFRYPRDEQNYVIMFYLNGITAIINQWLKDGCQKSIEDISSIIRVCIYGKNDML